MLSTFFSYKIGSNLRIESRDFVLETANAENRGSEPKRSNTGNWGSSNAETQKFPQTGNGWGSNNDNAFATGNGWGEDEPQKSTGDGWGSSDSNKKGTDGWGSSSDNLQTSARKGALTKVRQMQGNFLTQFI